MANLNIGSIKKKGVLTAWSNQKKADTMAPMAIRVFLVQIAILIHNESERRKYLSEVTKIGHLGLQTLRLER